MMRHRGKPNSANRRLVGDRKLFAAMQRFSRLLLSNTLIVLLAHFVLVPLPARAAAPGGTHGRVVFIVDSTSNMGGLFGGSSKLVAVTNALASVWPNYASRLDMGLVVFGHRVSGKTACNDVDRLRPVAPIDSNGINDIFSTLKTKGDAPVAAAIAAASNGKFVADDRTAVILIAGGPESCQNDPCATTGKFVELRKVPIHVIAIDAGGEAAQLQSLKCVADVSKGNYWQVASTMELAAAMDDALGLAANLSGVQAAVGLRPGIGATFDGTAPGSTASVAAGQTTASLDGAPLASSGTKGPAGQVSLSALLVDGGPALTTGLVWRVFAASSTGSDAKKVMSSTEAAPVLTLPAGEYLINVAYGRSFVTRKLKVAEGSASEQFVLNAGGLKLGARLGDGSLVPAELVSAEIFSDERDQFGNRTKLTEGIHPGIVVRLNSGLYHVAATYGDANATVQSDVAIEAGRITDATVSFTAGRVTFRLVKQNGGEALTGTSWTILGSAGETVKHSLAALPTHILAPGDYSVSAERGGKQYTQDFTVKAGETAQVEVVAKE